MSKSLRVSGLGVQEISSHLGVTRDAVSRWINGRNKPSKTALMVWSNLTGVDLVWLETGEVRHQGLEPRTRWLSGPARASWPPRHLRAVS